MDKILHVDHRLPTPGKSGVTSAQWVDCRLSYIPIRPVYCLQFLDCSWLGVVRVGEGADHRWNLRLRPIWNAA